MSPRLRVAVPALLLVGGCSMSPDDRAVGIYSLDPVRTEVPEIPGVPGIQRRIRELTRNTKLKVHSDHTFVLTGARVTEGSWRLEGETLRLKPKDSTAAGLLGGDDGEIQARIDSGALVIEKDTPLGRINLHLRKTG